MTYAIILIILFIIFIVDVYILIMIMNITDILDELKRETNQLTFDTSKLAHKIQAMSFILKLEQRKHPDETNP